ncbi:ATP-dependent RecD-like DNA helicase [Sodalis praecaptivus]
MVRAKVAGHRDLVTVTGNTPAITTGEYIECQGVWFNDVNHGMQFKTHQVKTIIPTTQEGMEKYLGSGMVKGIGPGFARRLVRFFGDAVFDVIERHPERLLALSGIGKNASNRLPSPGQSRKWSGKSWSFAVARCGHRQGGANI